MPLDNLTDNTQYWKRMDSPPPESLKTIRGGRLSGFTDINPQWRYEVMTQVFGPIGLGWKYTVDRKWMEIGSDQQMCAFADISLYVKFPHQPNAEWSDPIPGNGGASFIAKESNGLKTSDECYKMAITDALSVAMKMLGVGAQVYQGRWDGTKYKDEESTANSSDSPKAGSKPSSYISADPYLKKIQLLTNADTLTAFRNDLNKENPALSYADKKKVREALTQKSKEIEAVSAQGKVE